MKTTIDPDALVSTKTLSELTGVPIRTLTHWRSLGVIGHEGRGLWRLAPTVRAIVAHSRGSTESDTARGRLLSAQAALTEAKAGRLTGDMVPAELAAEVLVEIAGLMRAEVDAWSGRLSPEIVGVTSIGEARLIVQGQANETLDRLHSKLVDLVTRLQGAGERRTRRQG